MADREKLQIKGGVEEVTGDSAQQMITVTYREGVAEPDGVREAIIDRGFLIA